MAFQNPHSNQLSGHSHGQVSRRWRRKWVTRLGSGLMALSLSVGAAIPALAADPFRANTTTTQHDIGPLTENAFEAIFKEGNYVKALDYLARAEAAEANEPLVHAMMASMAYLQGDFDAVAARANQTQVAAETLLATDPMRGHLYTAVGTFLEGAYVLKTQGVAKGTPTALGMLQQVFGALDDAEEINASDPELNLLKGYMDLMLAVNLPFSNPEEAIERMENYGSPIYLTQRGIAVGHRDLGNYDQALIAVDKALDAAPNNPELHYLKGQILRKQGAQGDSRQSFAKALEYTDQLPTSLVKQMTWEGCLVAGVLDGDECVAQRDAAVGAF
ncbi:MAG: Sll0314/Alr1548 family TPR repeat-containing protein [Phormidesmis sp.]